MTHSKLVKTVNRKTHPQNCPYQSWRLGRLMLRCGDHSRSRPVDCLAAELSPLIENLAAVYGRETDLKELLPFPIHCPACQNPLAECRSSAAAAIIVDLAGIVEKQHVPLRCRRPSCPGFGVLYWHNYRVREGRHVFHGKLPGFRCFMLSSVFGFSVPWLQQFHAGLVRLPAYVCSSAKVGLHGAFSQGHWGQI